MPRRDGTGPYGLGAATGRGRGFCQAVPLPGYGAGRGYGWNAVPNRTAVSAEAKKAFLQLHKAELEDQLRAIDEQLNEG